MLLDAIFTCTFTWFDKQFCVMELEKLYFTSAITCILINQNANLCWMLVPLLFRGSMAHMSKLLRIITKK